MSAQTLIWLLIALISIADSIALPMLGMTLDWSVGSGRIDFILSVYIVARLLLWLQKSQAAQFTMALVQFVTFCHVVIIFSYALMAASPFPWADPLLGRADVALGFDWLAWYQWLGTHQNIRIILILAYYSMIPQGLALTAIFCYVNPRRVNEFFVAAILAMIFIFPFIYLLPSMGAFVPHGVPGAGWENDILAMRSHATHVIQPAQGIVTFPSYHVVLGVLFINMARGRWWLFGPVLLINALMIASVMNIGGHYFVDVPGGIVVAAVALGATHYLLALCSRESTTEPIRSTDPMPV